MSNDVTDEAVNAAEKEATGKRGGKRPKRPGFWYGFPAGTKVVEVKQPGEKISKQDAEAKIKAELGDDAVIIGPRYDIKGFKSTSNKATVTVPVRDLRYTTNRFTGVLDGWKFIGNGVAACTVNGEEFDDDDLIHAEFDGRVDKDSKTRKPRLVRNSMIRRSASEEVKSI